MKFVPHKQHGYRHQAARERARAPVRSVAAPGSRPRRRWSLIELWMWAGIVTSGVLVGNLSIIAFALISNKVALSIISSMNIDPSIKA